MDRQTESEGELKRVSVEVDWNLELGGIARKVMSNSGPALLFENIKGYNRKEGKCGNLVTATLAAAEDFLSY